MRHTSKRGIHYANTCDFEFYDPDKRPPKTFFHLLAYPIRTISDLIMTLLIHPFLQIIN